jgi:transcriptional regulator with XRE-family HTH domain
VTIDCFRFWDIIPDMEIAYNDSTLDVRLSQRLKALRHERNWSLDELSHHSGVSRASLSRLENASVSATAQVLGKLCAAFGLPLSRLMVMVEQEFEPVVRREQQLVWTDPESHFRRRSVSPPAQGLSAEVIAGELPAGARIAYDRTPRPGLEHHLVMTGGELVLTVEGQRHTLQAGDCLRYRLNGSSLFETPPHIGASYFLFIV